MSTLPLRRNRDFMLLQTGQLLSSAGTQCASIAYPLLVLAITHSAAKSGFVAFARILPAVFFSLPSGLAADRFDRKRLMILADAVRALALAGLAAWIIAGGVEFWWVVVVAFVEGAGAALFVACSPGATRSVVPPSQLPAAYGAQSGRQAAALLAGPPLGGALFGLARSLPFVADAVSYIASTCSLVAMHTPFQQERVRNGERLRARLAEGFRFLWGQRFLRTCALLFGLSNFIGPGLLLAIVVIGTAQGVSSAGVGILVAAIGACLLLGSFLAPFLRRRLRERGVLLLELWITAGCAVFLVWPNVYVLAGAMMPWSLVIPASDSIVHGYRVAMTPDRLLGRSESVRSTISIAIAPFGPLVAGLMLEKTSPRATIALFTVAAVALALWGTLSQAIRHAPRLDDLVGDSEGADAATAQAPTEPQSGAVDEEPAPADEGAPKLPRL